MQTRNLGSLTTSAIGFGAMALVDGMYGHADDEHSLTTLRHAIDAGATMIDTSDAYAAGANEQLVGRAIEGREVQLATKWGIVFENGRPVQHAHDQEILIDARPERAREAAEGSLKRLGVDALDLWYLHFPDPGVPVEETVDAMAELVAEGKVRHLGLSNVSAEQVIAAHQVHPIAAVQGEYSLWTRDPERELLPVLQELGRPVLPRAPHCSSFICVIAAPNHELSTALGAAIERETGLIDVDPLVTPARQPGFDLQANFAMKLAKQLGEPPRGLAERVAGTLGDAGGALAAVEVSGPGFVNLAFSSDALAKWATEALADPRLGVAPATTPQIVTVDYSAPNVAKEMHVGHLRSTVIGDALVRLLEFAGHRVIRMNHLGDWGTQFGMLTQHMLDTGTSHLNDFEALGQLYRAAKERFDAELAFADRARLRVVALQSGDPETIALWQDLVDVSLAHINALYGQLDVTLTDEHVTGESFYNDRLPGVVDDLLEAGVAVESDGAVVVVSERFTNPDGTPAVLIVRKRDGGFGYGATDLASIRYRVAELHADRLIYITDARQSQHFQQVFDAAARAGWVEADHAEHIWFGTMLGEDGKPFKTRSGGTIRLSDLLDDAIVRARRVVDDKSPDLPEAEREEIARVVGIGAVKYADLSTTRQRDLLFSFDRMLALTGNSAPYLLYACTRAASIVAKAGVEARAVTVLDEPAERALVVKLSALGDVLAEVEVTLEPHRLCNYFYELAGTYTAFYDACPVLKAEDPEARSSRLALCTLTAETLETGLGLLGITVPASM